jgi:thymidylate synthase ThyX
MKIHLISYTHEPLKSIAAAILNIGIGKDIKTLDDITYEEAKEAFLDTCKSFLDSPLEFASFNFFWEDIPLFLRSELERARIGWSYAERSMRFYQAGKRDPVKKIDWAYFPSIKTKQQKKLFLMECGREMKMHEYLKFRGLEIQEARCVIGTWYGTALQTSCTFRALRDMMALRLSSQAHAGWRDAAGQIKKIVTEVDKTLGDSLVNICEIQKRCVWQSKMDRPCEDCIDKPWAQKPNHIHDFSKGQCSCGEFPPKGYEKN